MTNWEKYLILRMALEQIYGTATLTLADARTLAHQALEKTDGQ